MIILFFKVLRKLPEALYWWFRDLLQYIKEKWYLNFERWGLHVFVGVFGSGKTSTMVYYAFQLAEKYKCLTILTNLQLHNFPAYTQILQLRTADDILNAPTNTLVLIDEIGTIFNSRDFSSGKGSLPKSLFQHLCQCRKRHMMIWGTVQRWNFLDKQLRDICATVYVNRSHFSHPFCRLFIVRRYDAAEYDLAFTNPLFPLSAISYDVYVQTDKLRALYSTEALIQSFLDKPVDQWLSDAEILENQGESPVSLQPIEKRKDMRLIRRKVRR